MTLEKNKELVRRWMTGIWEEGNTQLLKELAAENYSYYAPGQGEFRDESFVGFVNAVRAAIPDLNNTFEEQIAEGDTVVTRGTTRGTHQGAFGDIAASGNAIEVPWAMITKIKDGQIAAEWEIFDTLTFMTQLGALSATE